MSISPDHIARAYTMLHVDGVALGNIAIAELLATQLAEVDRLTQELKTERAVLAEVRRVVNKHRGDCGAGTDMAGDVELAFVQLAERTRERDDALLEAASRLRDDDAWDGFQVQALDLAAKWGDLAGAGRTSRERAFGGCSTDLHTLAKQYPEEPTP